MFSTGKWFFRIGVVAIALLLQFSCAKTAKKADAHLVFRYNEHANIQTLDPAFAKDLRTIWATNQLFNGLVQLNDRLEVLPDIASSWEITDTGKTYTFHLRTDVQFHKHPLFGSEHTRKVVASDFVYSLNRLQDPRVASPGKWVLEHVQNFSAVNDSTFVIQLKQPFPPFLSLLSMKYCSVVPKESIS